MPSAEIIAIGTELLLGEIQDTNTRFLTRQLRDIGLEIYRTTAVGDNAERIAGVIREALTRADVIITTGGLGPTVDDPTRDAVALAFNTHTDFHQDLWESIEVRFLRRNVIPSANNRRQAYLPHGAHVIVNPVGTAPAFYFEYDGKVLISLPGVPREMETLTLTEVIPFLKIKYKLNGIIKAKVLHLSGIGESTVDDAIGEFEKLTNPTVGLLTHPGIVDVRITAKANSTSEADEMISSVESKIRSLFDDIIFGVDDLTLAQAVNDLAHKHNRKVVIFCSTLQGLWPAEFVSNQASEVRIIETPNCENSKQDTSLEETLVAKVNYHQEGSECHLEINITDKSTSRNESNIYNGPPAQGPTWAINRVLELIRRTINQTTKE